MKFNVVYNKNIPNYKETLSELETLLISNKVEFCSYELDSMENFGDFTLVIGGDGTILKAARFYSDTKTPVLGINLGRLGFLSQQESLSNLIEAVLEGEYYIEERMMLSAVGRLALNDFVIKGCDSSRTSKIILEINDSIVCDYIADGLIISTPTGSTAYGLSAGGPVLYPTMEAIVIVPICPHTLNARPLVVPFSEKITIKTGDKLLSVSVDGFEMSECTEKITIKTAPQKAVLAFLDKGRFYSVLRNKLHWGISPKAY
ncbi:NAD(+)/NADH kinase [bacterium]|nr:NAD(+)/NADH kinase [bacterium]